MAETILKLRSNLFSSVEITAITGGLTAGQMYKEGSLVGVIVDTVKSPSAGKKAILIYECPKIVVPKKAAASGQTITIGAKVYYNDSLKNVSPVASAHTLCGRALEDAASTATEVLIHLTGNVAA